MNFALDHETRRQLGYQLIDRINAYFDSLPDRAVQLPAGKRTFDQLGDSMPELAADASRVLDDITTELIDKGFHVPAANYFGLMNPTPTYIAVLAEALVAALNPQLASLARSQLASKIEAETVRWIGERVGWTSAFDGTFTSGGNEANFSALAMALATHFPNSVEEGVASIGAQPVLYASAESHHSLDKSVGLLGLGRRALRRIPVNSRMQLDPAALEAAIRADLAAGHKPFCIVGTAGTTNSGAVDDLVALAEIARATSSGSTLTEPTAPPPSSPTSIAISFAASSSPTPSPSIRTSGSLCPSPLASFLLASPLVCRTPLASRRPICPRSPARP